MKRYDYMMNRCPKLGSEVTFGYCRIEQGNLPCTRIISCWPVLPVERWMQETFSPEMLKSFLEQPAKSRIDTIFETLDSLSSKS